MHLEDHPGSSFFLIGALVNSLSSFSFAGESWREVSICTVFQVTEKILPDTCDASGRGSGGEQNKTRPKPSDIMHINRNKGIDVFHFFSFLRPAFFVYIF